MDIIAPQLGLFFWTTLIFLVFFFLLRAFAWKPIMGALSARENRITESLEEAKKAQEEMTRLKSDNEALMKEARAEREKLISEANEMRTKIIKDARAEAQDAAAAEREKARQQIEAEKNAALNEIKQTSAALALEIAEKVLRKEFSDKGTQQDYVAQLVSDLGSQN